MSCKTTLLTVLSLSRDLQSTAMKTYLGYSEIKTAKSQQRTSKLLKIIRVLWTTDNRDRTGTLWWNAKVIEVILSNMQGMILSTTICYYQVASYQDWFCKVKFLKPRDAFKFLWNLDSANDFNESVSVWTIANEFEPSLTHCFSTQWKQWKCIWKWYKITFHCWKHWRTCIPESVSQLNIDKISKISELGLHRENFRLVNNASNMCNGPRTYSVESPEMEYLKSFSVLSFWGSWIARYSSLVCDCRSWRILLAFTWSRTSLSE